MSRKVPKVLIQKKQATSSTLRHVCRMEPSDRCGVVQIRIVRNSFACLCIESSGAHPMTSASTDEFFVVGDN